MSDERDESLMALAGEAARRERDAEPDPRWDALAYGELDDAEREALREAAGEDFDALEALFTGGDAAAQEAQVDALLDRIEAPAPSAAVPLRRSRWRLVGGAAAAVMLAAAAWLIFVPPRPSVSAPVYELEVSGGQRDVRGTETEDGPRRLGPTARLTLSLVPEVAADPSITAVAFARGAGGARPLALAFERSETGSFRWAGGASELGLPPGDWTLVLLVGPEDALPHDADALAEAEARDGVRALQVDVRVEVAGE